MHPQAPSPSISMSRSRKKHWIGRTASYLAILALLPDALMKILMLDPVLETHAYLEIPAHLTVGIGVLLIVCTGIYIIPSTAVLGAILLTGYLGGATAMLVRIGDPFLTPVIVGMLVWVGLYLTDDRLRNLIPIRR